MKIRVGPGYGGHGAAPDRPRPSSARLRWPLLFAVFLLVLPGAVGAQAGGGGPCSNAAPGDEPECRLALAGMRAVQERVGVALWGGNPVPGTASTLGLRIGSTPRVSLSARLALVPADLPPVADRARTRSERTVLPGFGANVAVGVLPGWSPLPTVGGVLSLDLIGRVAVVPLSRGRGFEQGAAAGGALGARIGLLRESFTLPGVSLTGSWGQSTTVGLGDPAAPTTDGFARGTVSDLSGSLSASRRIGPLRFVGGVASDRYASGARLGYPTGAGSTRAEIRGRVTTTRRSWFVNAAWTSLIFHVSAEAGWQERSSPDGLPPDVRLDPVGWWTGLAFRVSL